MSEDVPGPDGARALGEREIARAVGRKRLEAQSEREGRPAQPEAGGSLDSPLVVGGYGVGRTAASAGEIPSSPVDDVVSAHKKGPR